MKMFNDLVDGKIGRVVVGMDFDDENEDCYGKFICEDVEYELVKEDGKNLVSFDVDGLIEDCDVENDLVLMRSDGYRGICCYEGLCKVNGKIYWLDIMNDWIGYEVVEK